MTTDASAADLVAQTRNFRWGQVPSTSRATFAAHAAHADPPLGVLAAFTGSFRGNGLNTIFRPQDFAVSPTHLDNVPATGPNDNILEINLTEETLTFLPALGSVPNRGMVQGDMFLNGVPYIQTIKDVTDPAAPVGIHFEPGVWLNIPETQVPAEGPSVARMASIPHGTTIEAQGSSFTVNGGPQIDPVDITPFPIGDPTNRLMNTFPSQDVASTDTFRIPQDLTAFIAAGTITKEILANPNLVLKNRSDAQGAKITSTAVITITTDPADPLFGGGTDNIAFLLGDKTATSPNANAVQMTAIFWIETVADTITVPPTGAGQKLILPGTATFGDPVPTFAVTPTADVTTATQVDVTYTQIQYTQTVLLNFNGLTWPHVSVANLVPNDAIEVSIP